MSDQGNSTGSPAAEKVTDQKMDAALKAKWVGALRSGKFHQIRGCLYEGPREGKSRCCLGVLWDICGRPEHIDDLWYAHIPDAKGTLIEMNDKQLKSFPEIADYIEQNL